MAEEDKNVLIVDGEKLSGLIAKMLAGDFSTDVAHNGVNAVQKLRESLPHAIVVEVDIPGNGIKLTALLGLNPKYSIVPIIITAANPSPDMIIRSRNAGADSFLAKPFKPSDLKDRLVSLSAAKRGPSAGGNGGAPSAEGSEGSEGVVEEPQGGAEEDADGLSVDLTNRVKSIEGLPSFPATHAEILKLAHSEDSTSDEVAEKLQLDSGLLATVFKLVNSSRLRLSEESRFPEAGGDAVGA
jgi:DNA-binding response OmpR family regulator